MSTHTPAVELRGVSKDFGSGATAVEAVRDVSLSIESGEFVAMMGPSGVGKSTILHLIGGLEPPTQGEVLVEGRSLSSLSDEALTLLRRRRVGFVFQRFNLMDVLTARENIALPLEIDGVSHAEALQRADGLLERVGLTERAHHTPGELSGGEQQRVAIARALVAEPVLLLADEPTGNLDSTRGDEIVDLLREIVDESKPTLVMVTHDSRIAAAADRIVHLRDGSVVDDQRLPPDRPVGRILEDLDLPI